MNQVPHDLPLYRKHLECVENSTFEFFMPLEILNGQSTADFYINNPDMMAKEVKILHTRHHKDSMITAFLKDNDKSGKMWKSLIASDWIR